MRDLRTLLLALCTALLCAIFASGARAGVWEKTTVATFSAPVEVPGQVLPAGTYVFRLADSASDRHIVQVWNQDQTHLIATVQAVPDYRPQPSNTPVLNFEERPGNLPMALKEWFYPGDYYGQEFVYESRPAALAGAAYSEVPTSPSSAASTATDTMVNQSSPSDNDQSHPPAGAEPNQATQSQAAPSTDQNQATQSQATPSTSPDESKKELPKTASSTPLIGLIGMLSLAAGLGLRQFAKRVS